VFGLDYDKCLDICRSITKGSDLSSDLCHDVFLFLHRLQPKTELDALKLFKYIAYTQWKTPGYFSRTYGHHDLDIKLPEEIEEQPVENSELNEFLLYLLDREPQNERDLVVQTVVKLRFEGLSLNKIASELGINHETIRKIIKNFECYVKNCYNSHIYGEFLADRSATID
jgi:DNA-directed RNA polymerase specialized sigma24 family protein